MNHPHKRTALGQGLSALLGPDLSQSRSSDSEDFEAISFGGTRNDLPIHQLVRGAYQPRKWFDDQELDMLAQSIKHNGLIQPIVVRPKSDGIYEIIAGERRWRAAERAGLKTIPVLIQDQISDQQALEIGLLENVQRQDLSPIEEAEGYQRLIQEFGYTQEAIAQTLGKSRPHITNTLRLLNLSPKVRGILAQKVITPGHARTLLSVSSTEADRLVDIIVHKNLNVRQTERLIRNNLQGEDKRSRVSSGRSGITGFSDSVMGENVSNKPEALIELEEVIQKVFQTPCEVQERANGIQLTMVFKDYDHLDQFLSTIA